MFHLGHKCLPESECLIDPTFAAGLVLMGRDISVLSSDISDDISDILFFSATSRLSLTDYENGVLPLPPPDPLLAATGVGNGVAIRPMAAPSTLSRHRPPAHAGPAATMGRLHSHDSNDSSDNSWMGGSSRSRETSPESSSIPPGMAPFRVIPLHSAESESRSLSADPGGTKFI